MKKADRLPKEESPPAALEASPKVNGVAVLQITTLEQLQNACDELIHVKVVLPSNKGVTVALIPVRLLRPNESERLELILKEAHPPMKEVVQPDGTKQMQYVPTPETLQQAAALQRVARAMALWWACPLFRESEEGKALYGNDAEPSRQAIVDFVQSKFTESILEKLYTVARSQEFELEDRVNFTTPPA
jgi:hypothetical protein